jgi:hypothetical protein
VGFRVIAISVVAGVALPLIPTPDVRIFSTPYGDGTTERSGTSNKSLHGTPRSVLVEFGM